MSMNSRHDLLVWLGPAADEMTGEQFDLMLDRQAENLDRFPDPDSRDERQDALNAACQEILARTEGDGIENSGNS